MTTQQCKKCKKRFKQLADDTCFFCDKEHWYKYMNKLYQSKK